MKISRHMGIGDIETHTGRPRHFWGIGSRCQKLGAVGLTALGRAQLCPAVAGGALLRLSLPGPRCSLRAICPYGARLVNVRHLRPAKPV